MPKDLGAIKRLIGPRKRHASLSVEAAKQIKQRPIDGDFEPLLDETRETRDQLQQYLADYKNLRKELEDAAIKAGKSTHETVMADYEEYMELVFEAEQLVVGLGSKMEMIKDRMDFMLKRGTLKVNHDLDEKMLEIERQKAEIEHRKLQMEVEKLNLEKVKLERKLQTETTKPVSKPNTVKLPKLEFKKFNRELLLWPEFWDSFDSAIHSNPSLSPVDKMNYLKAKLDGEAAEVISGLALTNVNYEEAIRLLQERYGQNEIIINAHYSSLMDLPTSSSQTASLRSSYDVIGKHLRSLEALGEDVNSKLLVSLILTELPKDVLIYLTDQKPDGQEWTVKLLREKLHRYITNRGNAERQSGIKSNSAYSDSNKSHMSQVREVMTTTEALFSNANYPPKIPKASKRETCIYCKGKHWSDECQTFTTLTVRKEKIKGRCFICLKKGHTPRDCKADKLCVHCQETNRHHRGLCPKKFPPGKSTESVNTVTEPLSTSITVEDSFLATGEQVLMQTATAKVQDLNKSRKQTIRLLLDTGSQRTYITEDLAKKLQLVVKGSGTLSVFTFSNSKPQQLQTPVTELSLLTKDGSSLHLRVNVVPKITGTLQRAYFDTKKIEHLLKDVPLADSLPTASETASIELLLGNDYYCDIFSGEIPFKQVAPGLNLMKSKLGWILTGRIKSQEGQAAPSVSMLTYSSGPISAYIATSFNGSEPLTKICLVFDTSAKTRKGNRSLNECLHCGPVFLEDLCALLVRFRLNKVALIADVEKAFLQVGLQPDDRDVTQFFWLKDVTKPTLENNVQILRFTRVPFGMISSPFLLAATVKYHLNTAETPVAQTIANIMYVDNVNAGVSTPKEAGQFHKEAKPLFLSSSMKLREWASSCDEFLKRISESDRITGNKMKVLAPHGI